MDIEAHLGLLAPEIRQGVINDLTQFPRSISPEFGARLAVLLEQHRP